MAGSPGETPSRGATRAEREALDPGPSGHGSTTFLGSPEGNPPRGPPGETLPPGTLERLVEENLGWLQGWLRGRVDDRELIHDVSQDSFLKAFRSMRDLKDVARFPAWLYRIAENTLRDHLRHKARRRNVVAGADLDTFPSTAVHGDPERAEEAERLLGAIRSLPPKYREPFLLRHSRGLPYARIGEILGASENAIQVRVFRARKMLAKKILGRA